MKISAKLQTATLIYLLALCVSWQWLIMKCIPGYRLEQEVREKLTSNDTWAISSAQGLRGSPSGVDVSNEQVFVVYNNNDCIDVYSATGEYEYTFLFRMQKGGIDIRCENDRLYVRDSDNTLYVFEGDKEIDRMTSSIASVNGYDLSWFNKKETYQSIDGKTFQRLDEYGQSIKEITVTPPKNNNTFKREYLCILAITTCAYIAYMLYGILVGRKSDA